MEEQDGVARFGLATGEKHDEILSEAGRRRQGMTRNLQERYFA